MRCANGLNCDIAQPVHEKVPRAVPGNVQDDGYAVREVQGGNRVDDIRFLPPLQLYSDGEVRGPSLEQVLEIEETLCARREKDETELRCLRSKGNAIGMTRMVFIGNTLLESRANKLLYNVWLYNRNVACIPDHPSI